jgi:sulfotransferase family protein
VASSLLGVPFESSRSVLSYAQRWVESVQAARAYARAQPGRLRTVVYEQLVREPEASVRELCDFVGLDYEPTMLEEFGREAARNVGSGEAWKGDIQGGVLLDRKGIWRQRMTPGQAWLVAQATHGLRQEFGYLDEPRASASSIFAASVREARVRFGEARASTGVVGAARHAGSVLKTLSAA